MALYNVAATGDSYYNPLAIFLRDDRVALLWITEPLRGEGYGRKLPEAAEDEARSLGCKGVHLATLSSQARPFCEKLGYSVVADIPDYPPGHAIHVPTIKLR